VWEGTKADVGVQWLQRARCRVGRVLDTSNFLPLSPSLVGAADAVKRLEIQGPSLPVHMIQVGNTTMEEPSGSKYRVWQMVMDNLLAH
jgi:hypothetical protein